MKILEYECRDSGDAGWTFDKVELGKINLFVGDSATGKSRLINTLFNIGRFAASKEFKAAWWNIVFEHSGIVYTWTVQTEKRTGKAKPGVVLEETLSRHAGDQREELVARDGSSFRFMGKQTLKLSQQETSISLLREEDAIKPTYEAFSIIQKRMFDRDALNNAVGIQPLSPQVITAIEESRGINVLDTKVLFEEQMTLSCNLFVLSKYREDLYGRIIDNFKMIFPFIRDIRIAEFKEFEPSARTSGMVPCFAIKERASKWVPISQFSSGMLKVLLILTDVFILPNEGVYIIEEYENSLGISAIDFFPQFVLELEKDIQFIMTSHHPYIINEIPISNWYVFHRNGMHVSIKHGTELTEKYGKSKQQAFMKLINDPFFKPGVE